MIRKKKNYRRPMKAFEAGRIKEENVLKDRYGLKNKTEIWKTQAKVDYYRGRAKALAQKPIEEQEVLFNKLRALGLKIETISDILDLKVENLLERRLSTIVVKRNIATTTKQARQLIVHKKILVNGKVVSAPSYIVPVAEESSITLKVKVKKPKAEPAPETPSAEGEAPSEPAQEESPAEETMEATE
ncbi:MAG: 30S ribosomal protein S4 [Nanoarchaeota archaeon]|nr:30S ribosomal protein S4 [Nanoarchaeota archaeon]